MATLWAVAARAGLQVRHPETFPLLYRDRPMTTRDADVVEELLLLQPIRTEATP